MQLGNFVLFNGGDAHCSKRFNAELVQVKAVIANARNKSYYLDTLIIGGWMRGGTDVMLLMLLML